MTIKLIRVELFNIRSHEHIVFDPASTGITAISGANGAGKSTIVDSVGWALFGTKPQNVSKIALIIRNGVVPGKKNRCEAIVDLMVDGVTYRIQRRIVSKSGTSECEVFSLLESDGLVPVHGDEHTGADAGDKTEGNGVEGDGAEDNGTEDNGTEGSDDSSIMVDERGLRWQREAGPAASHADNQIRRILHMDEKGFLSAILVQQKQVDALISAGAKDRAGVIEKLTGISMITTSLEEARREANEQKRALATFSIDADELAELRVQHGKLTDKASGEQKKIDALSPQYEEAKTTADELNARLVSAESDVAQSQEWDRELTSVTARHEMLTDSMNEAIKKKDDAKKEMTRNQSGVVLSLADAEQELLAVQQKKSYAEAERNNAATAIEKMNRSREQADELVSSSKVKTMDEAVTKRAYHENLIQSLLDESAGARAAIASNNASVSRLDKAIKVLVDGDGTCPTCLQHVDEVSSAVSVLEEQKKSLESDSDSLRTVMDQAAAKGARQREIVRRYDLLISALSTIAETDNQLAEYRSKLDSANSSLKTLSHAVKSARSKLEHAKEHDAVRTAYEAALKQAQHFSRGADEASRLIASLNSKIKDAGALSPRALSTLRTKANSAAVKRQQVADDLRSAQSDLSLTGVSLAHVTASIVKAESEAARYDQARASYQQAAATVETLSEFRESRIEKSVGGLELYASDLLSRFTDGKFTRLTMDTKFNTTVMLADGTERAVGLLSGGELSAAAMALRLAVSILLNGGSHQNLMILDEVLVSQDASRAELILSAIKEVFKGQVVIIAHNDSINAVADRVFSMSAQVGNK